MPTIRFYLNKELLKDKDGNSTFPCPRHSTHVVRADVARANGIGDFDCFILDDNRVGAVRVSVLSTGEECDKKHDYSHDVTEFWRVMDDLELHKK